MSYPRLTGQELFSSEIFSPSDVTINGSASVAASKGRASSNNKSTDARSKASTNTDLSSVSARNLGRSMLMAASTVPLPTRAKAVLRGKLSAAWLRDYLHLLRLTRKTAPAVAAIALLEVESGEAVYAGLSSSPLNSPDRGDQPSSMQVSEPRKM